VKKILDAISVGDCVVYSPPDMDSEHHDIAIVYDICMADEKIFGVNEKNCKTFKLFWNRTHDYVSYTEKALGWRLEKDNLGYRIMSIIKPNEKQEQ
jgi:hypothetical protein